MVLIRDLSIYDTGVIPYGDYDGLIIRCFNGSVKDTKFELHKTGSIIAGKPWWPYAFFNFLYPVLPQVDAVINILRSDPGALSVAWDVEEWGGHTYPGRDTLLANMRILHDEIFKEFGKPPQFYMNPATIHYLKPIPPWLTNCPLWIAHWGVNIPDFEPWSHWQFWQYRGEPDLNKFNGTDEEYWAYVGKPVPLPDKVKTTATSLYVRKTPNGTCLGYVPLGTIFGVNGQANDGNGKMWYKIGNAYVASWWVETIG